MNYSKKTINETKKTLELLAEEKRACPNESILDLLIIKYQDALEAAIRHDKSAFLHLRGGLKAYIDSTYQYDSPVANQLYIMEKICKKYENMFYSKTIFR